MIDGVYVIYDPPVTVIRPCMAEETADYQRLTFYMYGLSGNAGESLYVPLIEPYELYLDDIEFIP